MDSFVLDFGTPTLKSLPLCPSSLAQAGSLEPGWASAECHKEREADRD
jgi:hypothetical protein